MRVIRGVLLAFALAAWALPAYAIPPVFNGNLNGLGAPIYSATAYGAKCDKSTDDAAHIQAAINAADVTGGTVVLPVGTCLISTALLINSSSVALVGSGAAFFFGTTGGATWHGGSEIAPTSGFTSGDYLIKVNSTATNNGGVASVQTFGDRIADIRLLGNSGGTYGATHLAAGIHALAPETLYIDRVTVENTNGDGIRCEAIGTSGDHCQISDSEIDGSSDGVTSGLANGVYDNVYESTVRGDEVFGAVTGYYLANHVTGTDLHLDEASQYGYELGSASSLVGSTIFSYAGYSCIYIAGSFVTVEGGWFRGCNEANTTNGNASAILKGGGATNCTVTGASFYAASPAPVFWWYNADSTYSGCAITGNTFNGSVGTKYSDSTGTTLDTITNNIGINPYGAVTSLMPLPSSGVALTNTFPFTCQVMIWGGTVSAISVAGESTVLTSGTFTLGPNQSMTITYSVVPSHAVICQ